MRFERLRGLATNGSVHAVVMNMYYTGLGIARALGQRGIPVVGLTAQRGVYGNFTRFAQVVRCADSKEEPAELLRQLLEIADVLGQRPVLFPTRDHDLMFMDRFRAELEPRYLLVLPSAAALARSGAKSETARFAERAGVPAPRSWVVERDEDVRAVAAAITFPAVLKPMAAHHWRSANNWQLVGARKAIVVNSSEELLREYELVSRADRRALIQEAIPGADDCLIVAACYIGRDGTFHAGFNAQKLVQDPPGFGTGCVVQSIQRPELFERTTRLLAAMEFTGIAEVEYKWDARCREYKLIEVNPRPWDQHTLGRASGTDLILAAYRDHAGLPPERQAPTFTTRKWIAEDVFLMAALRLLWRRQSGIGELFRQARGRRIYAIWSVSDPLPFVAYLVRFLPALIGAGARAIGARLVSRPKPAVGAAR
jgi:predicted ATP-grasp superfamily ATP-dependent carboligase